MNGENPCIKDPSVHKLFFSLEPRLCVTRVTRDFKIHYGEALVRLMQPKETGLIVELIVLYYDMKVLDDAEFLLLYDLYSPQNLDLPCDLYPHFDLQNLTEDECVAEFRLRKTGIPRLSQALRIPDVIICHQGTICEGTEGLCMLLKRLCYPCRYSDMVHLFARPVPVLCMITNQVLDYIYQAHSHRILQWNHQQLSQANLEKLAEVVHRTEERKNDGGMLAESHLLDDLNQYAFSLAGQPLCIYGDLAYPTPVHYQ